MNAPLRYASRLLLAVILTSAQMPAWAQNPFESAPTDRQLATEAERAAGRLTLGGRFGDSTSEGYLDVLQPLFGGESAILFLNPKLSGNDDDEEEWSIGVGARVLVPNPNLILGANVFYDERTTRNNNRFDQVGAGIEVLSRWIDARANYYWPDDKHEKIDSSSDTSVSRSSSSRWGEIYPEENQFKQDQYIRTVTTTTTRYFERFEAALEGYDAEVGFRLPFLPEWLEARAFAGYYKFEGDFTDDIKGAKARLEVRALPAVVLDAEVYENKDLTGSDYFVGARLDLPFDVANLARGKNPFAGIDTSFTPTRREMRDRLSDMVMRDPHVRIHESDWIENLDLLQVDKRSQASSKTHVVMDDVNFVDNTNAGYEDGTAENPWNSVQEGVDAAYGEMNVYVFHSPVPYNETVEITSDGLNLRGQGTPIPGYAGKVYGGDKYPVVSGVSGGVNGPAVTVDADDVFITGFNFARPPGGSNPGQFDPLGFGTEIDEAGILALNANNLLVDNSFFSGHRQGVILLATGLTSYAATIQDSEFIGDAGTAGAVLGLFIGPGSIDLTFQNLTIRGGGRGFELYFGNASDVSVSLEDSSVLDTAFEGFFANATSLTGSFNLSLSGNVIAQSGAGNVSIFANQIGGDVNVTAQNNNFNNAGATAFHLQSTSVGGDVNVLYVGNQANDSVGTGGNFAGAVIGGDVNLTVLDSQFDNNGATGLAVFFSPVGGNINVFVDPTSADNNGATGIAMTLVAQSNITVTLDQVTANINGAAGVTIDANSLTGSVQVLLRDVAANQNGMVGVSLTVEAYEDILLGGLAPNGLILGNRISASNNGEHGFHATATSLTGDIFHYSEEIFANSNASVGISLSMSAAEYSFTFIDRAEASNNGVIGYIHSVGAEIAFLNLGQGQFNGNAGGGMSITLSGTQNAGAYLGQDLEFPFPLAGKNPGAVEANDNMGVGIQAVITSGGEAFFIADEVEASGNTGAGIAAALAAEQDVYVALGSRLNNFTNATVSSVRADDNGSAGITLSAVSITGLVTAALGGGSASGNGAVGVSLALVGREDVSLVMGGTVFEALGGAVGLAPFEANSNGVNGIGATLNSSHGSTTLAFLGGGASDNPGLGMQSVLSAGDGALVILGGVNPGSDSDPLRFSDNALAGLNLTAAASGDDATVFIGGLEANRNGGSGITMTLTTAHNLTFIGGVSDLLGDAQTRLIQANDNTGHGFAYSGSAALGNTFYASWLEANGNTGNGVGVTISSGAGDIDFGIGNSLALLPSVQGPQGLFASSNGNNGATFSILTGVGDIDIFSGAIVASDNMNNGFQLTVVTGAGDIAAHLGLEQAGTNLLAAPVQANNNGGIGAVVTLSSGLGDILATMPEGQFTNNTGAGFALTTTAGSGEILAEVGLNSTFNLVGTVEASHNGGNGVSATLSSGTGPAELTLHNITANSNANSGVAASVATPASAIVSVGSSTAIGNGAYGITATAVSLGSHAVVAGVNLVLNNNATGGLFYATGAASATSVATGFSANSNTHHGVVAAADTTSDALAIATGNASGNGGVGAIAIAVGANSALAIATAIGAGNTGGNDLSISTNSGTYQSLLP